MNRTVAHFIRKNSQLRSSFIQTQILNHNHYEPVVIYRYRSKRNDGGFAEFEPNDIPILDLSENKIFDINFRYLKKISNKDYKKVLNFLDKHNVSILHFHYGTDATLFSDVIRYSGRPSVVSFYGYDAFSFPKKFFGYGKRYLGSKIFKYVTKIFAMSPEMKNDLLAAACPEEKIIIHYYGVPSSLFIGVKKNYNYIENKKFTLLNISSFDPVKGHIFIFKAIKQLIYKGVINIKLKVAGGGFFESELRKFVIKNQLSKFVNFLGPLKYGSSEMLYELEHADAFIHPSVVTKNDKEGIPGALVEAMFAGLPIISTFHGGIPYVIEDGKTGLLVKEWDVASLVKKIEMLVKDAKLRERLGRAAQKHALENLDLHKKEQELETIYDSLLS